MTDVLIAIGLFIAICAVFTVPVGLFNTKMFRGINGSKPGGGEFLKAYIPFFNVRYSRVLAYGSSSVFMIFLCASAVLFLLRFVAIGLVTLDIGWAVYLFMISPVLVLVALLIWWVLAIVNAVDFARMLGCGGLTIFVSIIIPPVGYYMLANNVLPYFRKEETSLNGTFGTTD